MIGKQLVEDLQAIGITSSSVAQLRSDGIETYEQLFAFVEHESLSEPQRSALMDVISQIGNVPDRRKTVPLLIRFLSARDTALASWVAHVIGSKTGRRAVKPLLALMTDKSKPFRLRKDAANALCAIDAPRTRPLLRAVMLDASENSFVRSEIIEWIADTSYSVEDSIALLQDTSPDVRFWAAYKLSWQFGDIDIGDTLSVLDRIAAYDHALPESWGWHVDREALQPLEVIYARRLINGFEGNRPLFLISPVIEYWDFIQRYRVLNKDWTCSNLPPPEVGFTLELHWLKNAILQAWPNATFDVRDPRPDTYILNWKLVVNGETLLGGLHRDRYALILYSLDEQTIIEFAAWYRSVINAQFPLYFHEWADNAIELISGMTGADLRRILNERSRQRLGLVDRDSSS